MNPFIVHALPRSRTAWMAKFLSYNEWTCCHEQAIFLRSIYDIKRLFSHPYIGTVETASAPGWRLIQYHVPHIKMAVVIRPIDEVVESMTKIDLGGYATYDIPRLRKIMEYGNRMLHEIAEQPGVLTLQFSDLGTQDGCRALFEHCLPYRFNAGWWEMFKDENVQVDVPSVIKYYHENRSEIDGFKSRLRNEMRQLVKARKIVRH